MAHMNEKNEPKFTQVSIKVYMIVSVLRQQNLVVETEMDGLQSSKYLLLDPLQKSLLTLTLGCCVI